RLRRQCTRLRVSTRRRLRHSDCWAVSQWFAMLGARLHKHPGTPFTITYRETATFPLSSDVPSQAQNAHDFFLSTRTAVKLGYAMDRAEERTGPEDVGEQALMRGLDTAFPFFRLGLSRSEVGRRSDDRPHSLSREFPCRGPVLTSTRLMSTAIALDAVGTE